MLCLDCPQSPKAEGRSPLDNNWISVDFAAEPPGDGFSLKKKKVPNKSQVFTGFIILQTSALEKYLKFFSYQWIWMLFTSNSLGLWSFQLKFWFMTQYYLVLLALLPFLMSGNFVYWNHLWRYAMNSCPNKTLFNMPCFNQAIYVSIFVYMIISKG